MRLSHRDFDALQHTILELYEHREIKGFKREVPGLFLKVIPADHFIWNEVTIDFRTKQATSVEYFESSPRANQSFMERMLAVVFEHPFTTHFGRTGAAASLKISDFLTLTQFENSALFDEVYRPLGANRVMATICSVTPPTAASVNLSTNGKDFTERDRLILDLLRPHFAQAQRNALLNTARLTSFAKPLAAYSLTPRETEIAHWLANGKTNPEIAIILQISVRTVEKHMEKILEKLDVENRTTAAVIVANAIGV